MFEYELNFGLGVSGLSMANIPQGDRKLWTHAVVATLDYLLAYYLLYRAYKEVRVEFMAWCDEWYKRQLSSLVLLAWNILHLLTNPSMYSCD